MFILDNKNRLFNAKVNRFENNIFQAYIENKNGELMGEITFKIYGNKTWIFSISTEKIFQRSGVGKALISICEFISAKKRVQKIEGKFCPQNDAARPFYEKNGYQIMNDSYNSYIYKVLDIDKIVQSFDKSIFNNAKELMSEC